MEGKISCLVDIDKVRNTSPVYVDRVGNKSPVYTGRWG